MATRISALFFALLLAFGLAACGGPESGAALSGPLQSASVPEREPIGDPAVIAYPELLDWDLVASPLYQQALERPSVILYDGEVITGPQPVEDFLAAVEKGEDRDLYLYIFRVSDSGDRDCYLQHFISDKGTVTYSEGFENQWDSLGEGVEIEVDDLSLNEYGYLVYGPLSGCQVVNDRDLYSDREQRLALYDAYLAPSILVVSANWTSPRELAGWLGIFDDIYQYENGGPRREDCPAGEMVETLCRYFEGLTEEMVMEELRRINVYDPQTGLVKASYGRGGGPVCYRVTGWDQQGKDLSIDCERYDYYTGLPLEGTACRLTVRLLEDGSFRYLSNRPRVQ